MLPFSPDFRGRWCLFIMFDPSTITLFSLTKTRTILPFLPLSLPVIIITLSPFFIFIVFLFMNFITFYFTNLYNFRRQGNYFLKTFFRQLSWNWSEDASGFGVFLVFF